MRAPNPWTPTDRVREWARPGKPRTLRVVVRRGLIAVVAALALAGPVSAGQIVVKLALQSGKLAVAAPATTVKAGDTASIQVKVADGRGTGKGWTLKLTAATKGLTITGITAKCASNSTCTLPTAVGTPSGSTVLTALHDTGMGIIDLVVTVRASVSTTVDFSVA